MSGAFGARTMIDWDLAVAAASRLAGPGPVITRPEADAVVAELRDGANRSTGLVRDYTGLTAEERTAPVLVVDRTGWIQANADSFADVITPLVEKLQAKRGEPNAVTDAVGSKVTGLEVGGLLGFMSSKVLGQFDPFHDGVDGSAGRLLLVAPNIVHVENELEVDPRDFRLWVCLHEETHRVQFTAVPWLRDHLRSEIALFLDQAELDPSAYAAMFREGLQRFARSVKGDSQSFSLIDLMQTPDQRAVLDRLTAVMSLLEGHADFVMDGVGPSVSPTVDTIRAKFTSRRTSGNPVDQLLKRLLGLDAKLRQYQDGAAFVRRVVDRGGMEGFNRVWTGPNTLPTRSEIGDPDAWIARLHG